MKHFHISNRYAMRKYRISVCLSVSISRRYYGLHLNTLLVTYLLHKIRTNCENMRGKYSDSLVFNSVMQFIPLCRDILVVINVLLLNITFIYCCIINAACFDSSHGPPSGIHNTYLKHTLVQR